MNARNTILLLALAGTTAVPATSVTAQSAASRPAAVKSPATRPAAAPRLNDAEVAHAAVTANAVDIRVAEYAVRHATNASVKAFAETMIRDHTGVNDQAGALAKKLGVTPVDNAVSRSLVSGEATAMAALGKVKGAAFDVAYMDHEIAYHEAVIDAVDKVLVPQTSNGELKALLVGVRPALVAHLAHARTVRAGLR